jgi:hypothetical protein
LLSHKQYNFQEKKHIETIASQPDEEGWTLVTSKRGHGHTRAKDLSGAVHFLNTTPSNSTKLNLNMRKVFAFLRLRSVCSKRCFRVSLDDGTCEFVSRGVTQKERKRSKQNQN